MIRALRRWLDGPILCWLGYHDDRPLLEPSRIYAVCAGCGRQTEGWDLQPAKPLKFVRPYDGQWNRLRWYEHLGPRLRSIHGPQGQRDAFTEGEVSRRGVAKAGRGFFGVGIEGSKSTDNLGTLWRSAHAFGAGFLFTVGRRYTRQCSDTTCAWKHVPLFHYETLDAMLAARPHDCRLIGIELTDAAEPLATFAHPERAIYLLGAEDHGLSRKALSHCQEVVKLPGAFVLNVAVAGSVVMHDRWQNIVGG